MMFIRGVFAEPIRADATSLDFAAQETPEATWQLFCVRTMDS